MALALYSDTFWFPTGVVARNTSARVFPSNSTTLASLYSDINGTTPLANPISTDASGVLTFYAAVGEYWVHIDTESFLVNVGLSQEQADLSTGVASGVNITVNATNPQAFDITPFVGYVVSNSSLLSTKPTITKVDYPGGTVALDAAALARPVTFVLMDSAQNVVQQSTYPTPAQFRTHIVLGILYYNANVGSIVEIRPIPTILPQQANQLIDLMTSLGPFSISGNVITPNGVNLSFNKSAGVVFDRAFGYISGGAVSNDPHKSNSPAQTPATFRRIRRAETVTPPFVSTIDPANYDLNGVLTAVGGGAGSATVQRVWLVASATVNLQLVVQYGQAVYGSLAAAVAAIGSGTYVANPVKDVGVLIGYIAVIRTATDLSNSGQATFVKAGKFASP